MTAAPAIPQSGEAPQTWDSAELPAPVPPGVIAPRVTAHLFAPRSGLDPATDQKSPGPSANQQMLRIRAGLEQLEWCVPAHDGPWRPSPDTHALMARHAAAITAALTALLSIPTADPAPIEEEPDVEA